MMLSCWRQSPRSRPTFAELKATIDSLLLADRRDDYIEFSFDASKGIDQFDTALDLATITPHKRMSVSPLPRRHSASLTIDTDDCKLLLPSDNPGGDRSSPHLSPRKLSPRRRSLQNSRQSSPGSRLSSSCSSPKKEKKGESLEKLHTRQASPTLLFPNHRSPGSLSPQTRSPMHGPGAQGDSSGDRHRPVSLFVTRESPKAVEDRYVKEPTKLANLNQTMNHSSTGLVANGGTQQLQLRRGSEGTLNMNSDGYVSFVGVDYSRDRRINPSTSTEIQITVTQNL